MKKLRKADPVVVIAGKHTGSVSTIQRVSGDFVYLKDVNVVKKAKKGEGFVKKTLPLHVSSIAYYLKNEKVPTKIAIKVDAKGKKQRVAKKTGKTLD
ncbi:MAG: 50S ribosomal protein L24 [Candidatus Absconditabacteria bacterium]|nr:50S ribosomal protein L24 [Candidatus Absconditabacteria bacterium]MDD3868414.1 50S ribosomal protein L24 [Candidatus Absconditabacteria bacterium]MDD4714062.1 50S ribosomal protein L24 [Candidatus Absconditabacteria bacterium]